MTIHAETGTGDLHLEGALEATKRSWQERSLPTPDITVVAGSGLSVDLGERIAGPFPLSELLPFEIHAITGHPLEYEMVRTASGRIVLYYRGRIHAYQGYSAQQVVFLVRLAAQLGAGVLLISNAAGCLVADASPGDLFLITDQMNLTGRTPLAGNPPAAWGPRFPDMSAAYDLDLRSLAKERAAVAGVALREGVYAGLLGPAYETPAEVEMLTRMGAQLVGMSTVLEVIAARHMGVRCLGVSLATNLAAGVSETPLDHEEVLEAGREAAARVCRLFGAILDRL